MFRLVSFFMYHFERIQFDSERGCGQWSFLAAQQAAADGLKN